MGLAAATRRPAARFAAPGHTTTLATRTVEGHRFDLVSYLDTAGGRYIAIDRDGRRDAWACDIQVDEQHLASAAMTMATRGHGTAAIYGRVHDSVHDSVTELYTVMKNGERVDWPIYDDPRNAERYFAVIADSEALADIVAAAPCGLRAFSRTGSDGDRRPASCQPCRRSASALSPSARMMAALGAEPQLRVRRKSSGRTRRRSSISCCGSHRRSSTRAQKRAW
jgi:hypothetical protein